MKKFINEKVIAVAVCVFVALYTVIGVYHDVHEFNKLKEKYAINQHDYVEEAFEDSLTELATTCWDIYNEFYVYDEATDTYSLKN